MNKIKKMAIYLLIVTTGFSVFYFFFDGISEDFLPFFIISLILFIIILPDKKKKASIKKQEQYAALGLDKQEIDFFRETMSTAKEQIVAIEKNMIYTTKLQAIESRNNTVKIMHGLFKGITNHPLRLHEVDQFLYVHLPSLLELTTHYLEINQQEIKNKAVYEAINESAEGIDQLCQDISQDYATFFTEENEEAVTDAEHAKK
ncbi:5-bromo-4-chloroindolyl phosphate hydrolysis family protein [Isobaculum melis]|uniref:5-bromo-4-chloroindolyl phosphate hydrolysis protein n=1 Tax=Isobaculum melis TaxID=142588 RepID=A0A1H9RHK3_9LACT|nr:5-bromo-4-chloroindolyl phosphate hydrolysis family protein [Isobaculum melis]SER72108.1 5-bromo-4-chloroindolyl phosphate hydrolysis protein [Isobaculum melis]